MTTVAPSRSTIPKRVATVLTCVAALAGVAALGFVAVSAASANSSAAFGAYDGATTPPTALNNALGGNVKYAMEFQDGTSWSSLTQSSWPYSNWKGKGYSMIWGMP